MKTKTVKSKDFTIYLMVLSKILSAAKIDLKAKTVIHADNARVHTSKESQRVASWMKLKFQFLSPYSPQFACVELVFGAIKSKLRSHLGFRKLNFGKKEGMLAIAEVMGNIDTKTILRAWKKVITEAKKCIIE
jgi:hypothetical protein